MPRGRQLVAAQVRCQTIISMATRMTDEQWKQVFPVDRKLMLACAQQSLANRRPIVVVPFDRHTWEVACEKLGVPGDGKLREGE